MSATTPTPLPPPTDSEALRIKKFEELYTLAKTTLLADNRRHFLAV
jgi:hypothetical protein